MVPRLRAPLLARSTALFAALGLAPLSACGGTTVDGSGSGGGSGGDPSGSGGDGTGGDPSGTGGRGDGGAGGIGAGGAPGGARGVLLPCRNPTQVAGPRGEPTGFVTCEGGSVHRTAKMACPTTVPRAAQCPGAVIGGDPQVSGCVTDADCTEQPHGFCNPGSGGQAAPGCFCNYGCVRDADCGDQGVCICGDPMGHCAAAVDCGVDADCKKGLCLSANDGPCSRTSFLCQTENDTCMSDADCGGQQCRSNVTFAKEGPPPPRYHQCGSGDCAVGRPFLVGGEALVAGVSRREEWTSALSPCLDGLDAEARRALAAHWTGIALMEHASIAAFARFALELLSLGAPPELLVATHQALADETQHARDAFALASAYAGERLGPGPLNVDGALASRGPLDVVRTAILEGCIGETVAAVLAEEALAHATDPAVRAALMRVTVDEGRHAELAWRFVQWVLVYGDGGLRAETATALVGIVEAEIAATVSERRREPLDAPRAELLAHGSIGRQAEHEVRRRVLRDVVLPCARALAGRAGGERRPGVALARWT